MIRQRPILVGLVLLYMCSFSYLAFARGNAEFVMYGAAMVVFIVLVMLLHKRVVLSSAALWGLALWGLVHMAGGTVPAGVDGQGQGIVLYAWRPVSWLPRYDQVVHAFGFGVATLVCFEALSSVFGARDWSERRRHASAGLCVASALAAMGLGAVNEIVEFVATLVLPKTGVGGYVNTGWDLVSNATGASAVALGIWVSARGVRQTKT